MKKRQLVFGSFVCLLGSALLFSCKKETSSQGSAKQTAYHPSSISNVVRTSFDSSVTTQPDPGTVTPPTGQPSYSPVDEALCKLDWGYYYRNNRMDTFNHTPFSVSLPSGFTGLNSRVYAIGKDKAATQFFSNTYSSGPNFENIYAQMVHGNNQDNTYTILAIAVIDGKTFYALQSATVTGVSATFVTITSMTEITEEDLAALINSL